MKVRILPALALLLLSPATTLRAQDVRQGFDDITLLSAAGWVQVNNSAPLGSTGWFQGDAATFPAQGGAANAYVAANFENATSGGIISNWLITPPITLLTGATLTFFTRTQVSPALAPDRLELRMSTAGSGTDVGSTATSVGTFTTLLLDINPNYAADGYPDEWTEYTVTVTGVPTPTLGRLAFRYFIENTLVDGQYIGIDTVSLSRVAVDPTGNRVLEPGETALLVPTWTNLGSLAVPSLTGVVSDFTGPAGPTYTIAHASAGYGSIATGGEADCTATGDCYQVAVSGTRPATHWDTTLLETLNTGTTRTWTLHVGDSFGDVAATGPYYRFVETLLHNDVTSGCGPGIYCPAVSATREQMAVFVLTAKEGVGYTPPACGGTPLFTDVPAGSPYCRYVEELVRRGVVSGCGNREYCPTRAVSRQEMSVFLLRTLDPALDPPACTTPTFADVPPSNPFCSWIEELARRLVVTGCGGGNYCPTGEVTREQMAVFLSVTFGLTLY